MNHPDAGPDVFARFNVDLFDLFNRSTVTRENPAFGAFRQPVGIALARFVKVGAQFDF